MRKKDLIHNLAIAQQRIEALEEMLCPARQHCWIPNYEEECYVCKRCKKVRWMEDYEL